MYLRIPLPTGEGAAKRRVRGTNKRNCFNRCGTPHPARWRGPPSPVGRGICPIASSNMDTTAWNSSDSIVRFRDQREHIMRDNARPALSPIWYHAATQLEKYMRIVFGVVMAGCLLSG